MTSREVFVLLVVGVVLTMSGAGTAVAQDTGATAELEDAEGNAVGTAKFTEDSDGVRMTFQAQGLESGAHGIHIHETGECESPAFDSAGKHFNPGRAMHGLGNPEGPHAGDLPGITVSEDGTATYEAMTDRVTLSESRTSLFDADGSALVIHAAEDDQTTDPTGNSGDRVACGVMEKSATTTARQGLPKSGGASVLPLVALIAVASMGAGILVLRALRN